MKPSKYDTHHFSDQGSLISICHSSWFLQFVKCILPAKWWPQCLEYKNEVFVLSKDILGQVKNLNLYKHTYPTKQTSLTLWSICPWTLQVITFDPFNLLSFHVVKIQEKDQRLNFTKKIQKKLNIEQSICWIMWMYFGLPCNSPVWEESHIVSIVIHHVMGTFL